MSSQSNSLTLEEHDIDPFESHQLLSKTNRRQLCGAIYVTNQEMYQCKNNHDVSRPYLLQNPVGFRNFGMTCWLSSTLQFLINTDKFVANIVDIKKKFGRVNIQPSIVSCLGEIFEWYTVKDVSRMMDATKQLKLVLEQENCQFKGCNQHDVRDFMEICFDMVNDDIRSYNNEVESHANFLHEDFGSGLLHLIKISTVTYTF